MVPIVVQTTIFNTAPFWTSFLAWLVLGDKISCFEICAMFISFGGVVMIGMTSTTDEEAEEESLEVVKEESPTKFFTGRTEIIVGCICILVTAWGFSTVNVINRKLQKIPFAVLNIWYGLFAWVATLALLVGESVVYKKPFRLFSYDSNQYLISAVASIINFGTISCQTIAMQNERPGFVALLGYIGLVYAFLSDTFIFHERFSPLELAGITLILVMNLFLISSKMAASSKSGKK